MTKQRARQKECALIGKWRILEADLWDRDYLDLMDPAHIMFDNNGHGQLALGCIKAHLDCEYASSMIFFTWQGFDEMDEVQGNGSAELNDDGSLEVEIRFHNGGEAILKAKIW